MIFFVCEYFKKSLTADVLSYSDNEYSNFFFFLKNHLSFNILLNNVQKLVWNGWCYIYSTM